MTTNVKTALIASAPQRLLAGVHGLLGAAGAAISAKASLAVQIVAGVGLSVAGVVAAASAGAPGASALLAHAPLLVHGGSSAVLSLKTVVQGGASGGLPVHLGI